MKVKEQTHNGEFIGYLVNGNTFFPKENCEQVKQWIKEGNTPESKFTDEELLEQEVEIKKQEALTYLSNTDWYIIRKVETGVEIPLDILTKRAEARLIA